MTKIYFKRLFIAMTVLLCCNVTNSQNFNVDGIFYKIISETELTVEVASESFFESSYTADTIVVPETISYEGKNYSVKKIGVYAFRGCTNLKSVTLPKGIISIDSYAFRECPGLTSITLPDSLTTIGGRAFDSCTGLTSVTIPAKVSNIGARAFDGCTALNEIKMEGNATAVAAYAFDETGWYKNQPDGMVYLGNCFYSYKGDLTEDTDIVNAEGTTSISNYALSTTRTSAGYITSITLPATMQIIGASAFQGCSTIESITIPDGVTEIPGNAFDGCGNLTTVTMGKNITSISNYAFQNCFCLEDFTIGENVTEIGKYAFKECSSLADISIPDGVVTISESAFQDCSSLESVTIGSGVTEIAKNAFMNCYSLEEIEFKGNVTTIGENAFHNTAWYDSQSAGAVYMGNILYTFKGDMEQGTSINVKEGTTIISNSAFINRTELSEITFPTTLINIGVSAFSGCTGLTSITLPEGMTITGNKAFKGCIGITKITFPTTLETIGEYSFDGCIGLESVSFGENIKKIGNYAFLGCEKLLELKIPESVTSIGNYAFQNCKSLGYITLGSNLETIGSYALYNCTAAKAIYSLNPTPPTISNGLFSSSSHYANTTLYVPIGSMEAYKTADIWSKITNIKEYDFTNINSTKAKAPFFKKTDEGIAFVNAENKTISIYNVVGVIVEKIGNYAGETIVLDKGVYIVRVGDKTVKIRL